MGSIFPRKIKNSPLVASTAELRLNATLPGPALFALMYAAERERYPNVVQLPAINVPEQIVAVDPNWTFQPHYRLTSLDGKMSMQIGPRVFTFSAEPYIEAAHIKIELARLLAVFSGLQVGAIVERLGLRYINFFENQNVLERSTLRISLEDRDISANNTNLRSEVVIGRFIAALSLMSHATVAVIGPSVAAAQQPGGKQGSVLDIDVFSNQPEVAKDREADTLTQLFSEAHDIAKELFFRALKDDLIKELGPEF